MSQKQQHAFNDSLGVCIWRERECVCVCRDTVPGNADTAEQRGGCINGVGIERITCLRVRGGGGT